MAIPKPAWKKQYLKKKRLQKQADREWFQNILYRENGYCEVCEKIAKQIHHFYPKGLYGHLRYDLDNGISLCMACHFAHHHKGDPKIHQEIIETRGRIWLNRLQKKSLKRPKSSYKTLKYYTDIIDRLKQTSD